MKSRKKIATAIISVSAILVTAHVMQRSGDAQEKTVPEAAVAAVSPIPAEGLPPASPGVAVEQPAPSAPDAATVMAGPADPARTDNPVALDVSGPALPADTASPEPLSIPDPAPRMRLTMNDGSEAITPQPPHNAFGLTCGVELATAEKSAGMVELTVTAPCRSGKTFTVSHSGLRFSDQTDRFGRYKSDVPALTRDATFRVEFDDGASAEMTLDVEGARLAERVALQYAGETGLQIHALEFGAGYGDAGHVWAGNPGDAEGAFRSGGGFLTVLGNTDLPDAQVAEFYTLPANTSGRDGVVRLTVEARVTQANCGHEVSGQTIQRQADGEMRPVSLTLSMPDCGAVGEFLVLKNLLRDLKIASK
ncbi:hypothetical protein [Pseudoruegeria sp. HB172150]|uniref:hypothetical protein n=1 Tax=Pseudoruegeria sp. HB172150 TaxID=2721164 RepID=UPI00155616D6|nr:hypothetical protein [Pseudoruegeria sp. HB172150]